MSLAWGLCSCLGGVGVSSVQAGVLVAQDMPAGGVLPVVEPGHTHFPVGQRAVGVGPSSKHSCSLLGS